MSPHAASIKAAEDELQRIDRDKMLCKMAIVVFCAAGLCYFLGRFLVLYTKSKAPEIMVIQVDQNGKPEPTPDKQVRIYPQLFVN